MHSVSRKLLDFVRSISSLTIQIRFQVTFAHFHIYAAKKNAFYISNSYEVKVRFTYYGCLNFQITQSQQFPGTLNCHSCLSNAYSNPRKTTNTFYSCKGSSSQLEISNNYSWKSFYSRSLARKSYQLRHVIAPPMFNT